MTPKTITTRNWTTGSSQQKWAEAVCSPSRPTKRTRRNMQTWRPSSKTVSPTWAWRNPIMVGLAIVSVGVYTVFVFYVYLVWYLHTVSVLWCVQFCVVVNGKEVVGMNFLRVTLFCFSKKAFKLILSVYMWYLQFACLVFILSVILWIVFVL